MKHTSKSPPDPELAGRLLPERLSYLVEERPLLWNESAEDYDALFRDIFVELEPKGVIETLLVKDIVDYFWEARRMRSLKIAALHAELPNAASELLERSFNPSMKALHKQQVAPHVFAAVSGLELQRRELLSEMREAHVTPQMMQYEALKSGLQVMSAIDASITRLERRRDQLLKMISERRQAFSSMAKGLIERDTAEEIDHGQEQSS